MSSTTSPQLEQKRHRLLSDALALTADSELDVAEPQAELGVRFETDAKQQTSPNREVSFSSSLSNTSLSGSSSSSNMAVLSRSPSPVPSTSTASLPSLSARFSRREGTGSAIAAPTATARSGKLSSSRSTGTLSQLGSRLKGRSHRRKAAAAAGALPTSHSSPTLPELHTAVRLTCEVEEIETPRGPPPSNWIQQRNAMLVTRAPTPPPSSDDVLLPLRVESPPLQPTLSTSSFSAMLESSSTILCSPRPSQSSHAAAQEESLLEIRRALLFAAKNTDSTLTHERASIEATGRELRQQLAALDKQAEAIRASLAVLAAQASSVEAQLQQNRSLAAQLEPASAADVQRILASWPGPVDSPAVQPPAAASSDCAYPTLVLSKDRRSVKAGALYELVAMLTHHQFHSPSYVAAFLLTYHSFCSPEALLQHILGRWTLDERELLYLAREAGRSASLRSSTAIMCGSSKSALFCAVLDGKAHAVAQLLAQRGGGGDHAPLINEQDENGHTLLHVAADLGHWAVATALLQHGADADLTSRTGATALHYAARWPTSSVTTVVNGELNHDNHNDDDEDDGGQQQLHLVEQLCARMTNVNQHDAVGESPLHIAVRCRNRLVVAALLVRCDVNAPAADGDSPLHYAVRCNDRALVAALIAAGANVDYYSRSNTSPRDLAVRDRHTDLLSLFAPQPRAFTPRSSSPSSSSSSPRTLADRRASVHIASAVASERKSSSGSLIRNLRRLSTALSGPLASSPLPPAVGHLELFRIVSGNDVDELDHYLRKAAGVVNVQDDNGWSALHLAADLGLARMCEALCSAGANVDLQSAQGATPLHVLMRQPESEPLTRVAELLANSSADVDRPNALGESALHLAVRAGKSHFANLLLLKGASPNLQTADGETPLHYAVRAADTYTCSVLLDFDASLQLLSFSAASPYDLASRTGQLALFVQSNNPSPRLASLSPGSPHRAAASSLSLSLSTSGGGLDAPSEQQMCASIQQQTRLRVVAFLTRWIRDSWQDFEARAAMTSSLIIWLQAMLSLQEPDVHGALSGLHQLLLKKLQHKPQQLLSIENPSWPAPLLPKDVLQADVENDPFLVDPVELARQIALREQRIFQQLQPSEFVDTNWSKPNKKNAAPNVTNLVAQINAMAGWVAYSIVSQSSPRERAKRIEKWVRVAQVCRELANFNGVKEILGGLSSTAVHRLRRSWNLVDGKSLAGFEELKALMSPSQNSHAYRTALRCASPPCIPYLGAVLTDLTFAHDGMPGYLDADKNIINFQKCQVESVLISTIQAAKFPSYQFRLVPLIQNCLDVWLDSPHSQDLCFALSKILERD